jgi:hypothetical protein
MFLTHLRGNADFGEQIETLAAEHDRNLDLARRARRSPNRRQTKDLLVATLSRVAETRTSALLTITQPLEVFRVPPALHSNF